MIVALIGRPNVGKSTLFNRLSISHSAITHSIAGTTRDRKYTEARLSDLEFTLIDTPGLDEESGLASRMTDQTISAIKEADLLLFLVDNTDITPEDKFFASEIRKYSRDTILIVNKAEKKFSYGKEYYNLGFDIVTISALHGLGLIELYDSLKKYISNNQKKLQIDESLVRITVVGRPNVGKSTFINVLLNEERMLTGSESGLTRESIETEIVHKDQTVKLIDTAGLRRRANINENLEKLSASDSLSSINFANTVILMLDASIALEKQDVRIADYAITQGRSIIIAVNKWDLIKDKKNYREEFNFKIKKYLSIDVFVVYLSSKNHKGIDIVLDKAVEAYDLWNKKIPTSKLNNWLQHVLLNHPLHLNKKKRIIKIKYITQIKTRPPTFKLFCNDSNIQDAYRKYLIGSMSKVFCFKSVPLRMQFIKSKNPYAKEYSNNSRKKL